MSVNAERDTRMEYKDLGKIMEWVLKTHYWIWAKYQNCWIDPGKRERTDYVGGSNDVKVYVFQYVTDK